MGIPGLTRRLEHYKKRIHFNQLENSTLLIDGPSLGYHICGNNIQKTTNEKGISYDEYWQDGIKILQKLCKIANKVIFYFDGSLPDSKRPVRLERGITALRDQNLRSSFASMFMYEVASSVAGAAGEGLECGGAVELHIVPDEADNAIASVVGEYENPVILSSDSDFYTYRFKQGVRMVPLQYCEFLCDTPVVEIVDLSNTIKAVEPQLLQCPPTPPIPDSTIGSKLPSVHEIVNANRKESFMPAVLEKRNNGFIYPSAFETGKLWRSYAYYRLFGAGFVSEFYRLKNRYEAQRLESFDPKVYSYAEEVDGSLDTLEGVHSELTRWTCENEPASQYSELVSAYYTAVLNNNPIEWRNGYVAMDNVQIFAQIQAALYSLLLLQGTGYEVKGAEVSTKLISFRTFAALCVGY